VRRAALALVAGLGLASGAAAQDSPYPGPYFGEVIRVIDGDTFEAEFGIWPSIRSVVSVRIAGIDAPGIHRPAARGGPGLRRACRPAPRGAVAAGHRGSHHRRAQTPSPGVSRPRPHGAST
jgi:endonuclease YncB( thermonuclease family)